MLPYVTLLGWSFLAATVLPIGSEPAVLVLVRQGYSIIAIVVVATVGNYAGACTTYWIGLRARRVLAPATSTLEHRASRWITRYGQPALFFSWVPVLGDALVAAAGVARIPFGPFSAWVIAGKLLRYVVVAWGGAAWWPESR